MFSLILDGAILGSGLSEITPMSSPSPNTDLETGLAAISQKQYTEAIALLEPIATAYPQRSRGLRANMGLVVAYEHTGEVQKAIALCRQLTQSSQEKVKQWADRRLQALEKRYLTAENPTPPVIETGFMAFDPSLQPPKVQAANSPPLSPQKLNRLGPLNSLNRPLLLNQKNS
jgi:tetratricopeptide (TPR) repeat protein